MSGVSPSPSRLRAKTSDFTDFFRGTGHTSSQARQSQKDTTASMNLEVPSSCDEGPGTKKKITRIPLFGRSRKKSNQSTASSPFASSSAWRYSSEVGEQSSASREPSTDRRPSEPSLINVEPPPLPVPSKTSSSSLTSKFAAHFSHSRSSKLVVSPAESTPTQPAAQPSGLQPPNTRSGSFESGSSAGTKTRSTTPRPSRPTITVSLSPDNIDEFKDLFTRPTQGSESSKTIRGTKQRISGDSNIAPSPSSPSSPQSRSPEPLIYRRGHTPASAIAAAVRHRNTSSISDERPPSTASKNSRNTSDSDKSHERHDGTSTPRLSDARESPRPMVLEKEKGLPPSLQRRTSVATGPPQYSENAPSPRSRMKQPSAPSKSRPPSMPLPLPPTSNPPSSPPPSVPIPPTTQPSRADSASSSSSSRNVPIRPRAHTISSGVNPSVPLSPLSRMTAIKPATATPAIVPSIIDGDGFDIEKASAEELRQALKNRNLQYDELATYVLKMTEAHVAEATALEKKISALEKDALKREKQIQGLTWIINDGDSSQQPKPLPPGILNQSRFATSAGANESDLETSRTALPGAPRRLNYHSDSGAESHATSGGSGTESLSSVFRNKKLRRPYPLGDSAYVASRTGSLLRSSKIAPGVTEKGLPDLPSSFNPKRSSMSSMSASPSSSTSSLLPPSPSITMSSLSAIPEGPTSTLRIPRHDTSEPEDRRTTRVSHRTSTSSITSSSTAASSSYSANIKRSRPPSIAQVLEKSPNMENVLEKLRPFS